MFGEQKRKGYRMKVNRSKKKLQLQMTAEQIGTQFPETELSKLIKWLQMKELELMARGFTNLKIDYVADWDSPYELSFVGTREETDREFKHRMVEIEKERRSETVKMQEHIKYVEAEAKRLGML
jgi:hypothetical protein